jgi:hypothetical protein
MKLLSFKEYCYDEGFEWPLLKDTDEETEALAGYEEYLKDMGIEDIGKEEDMANIKGTCVNCERPDMMVDKCNRICGTCRTAFVGLTGEAKVQALAKAREKLKGRPKKMLGKNIKIAGEKTDKKIKREKPVKKVNVKTDPPAPLPQLELSHIHVGIRIPFTNRFVDICRLSIGGRHANV